MWRRVVRGGMIVVLGVVALVGVGDELRTVGEGKVGRIFVLVCGMWILVVFLAIEEWKWSWNCGGRIVAAIVVMGRRTRRCERSS